MSQTILFIRHAYNLGGAELYSFVLSKELKSLGYQVVLSSSVPGLRAKIKSLGFTTYCPLWVGRLPGKLYQLGSLVTLPYLIIFYVYILLRHRVAVANVMSRNDLWALSLLKPFFKFELVWTDHGDLKNLLLGDNIITMKLLRFGLGKCRAIICVSEDEKLKITGVLNWPELLGKLVVVPNGVEVGEVAAKMTDELIIGSTARIQPQKGLDVLVEALPEVLKKSNVSFKVLLAGEIDDERIVNRVKELNLSNLVSFVGYKDNVPGFLRGLQIYVFPSRTEVFPFSTLEAMAVGLPVVATKVGGIPEQIRDGVEGFLVSPGDQVGLSEAIVKFLNSATLRQEMGERAYHRVKAEFNIKIIAKKLLEVYGL